MPFFRAGRVPARGAAPAPGGAAELLESEVGAFEHGGEFVGAEGLEEGVVHAGRIEVAAGAIGGGGGEGDDPWGTGPGGVAADVAGDLVAVDAGQADVHEDEIETFATGAI